MGVVQHRRSHSNGQDHETGQLANLDDEQPVERPAQETTEDEEHRNLEGLATNGGQDQQVAPRTAPQVDQIRQLIGDGPNDCPQCRVLGVPYRTSTLGDLQLCPHQRKSLESWLDKLPDQSPENGLHEQNHPTGMNSQKERTSNERPRPVPSTVAESEAQFALNIARYSPNAKAKMKGALKNDEMSDEELVRNVVGREALSDVIMPVHEREHISEDPQPTQGSGKAPAKPEGQQNDVVEEEPWNEEEKPLMESFKPWHVPQWLWHRSRSGRRTPPDHKLDQTLNYPVDGGKTFTRDYIHDGLPSSSGVMSKFKFLDERKQNRIKRLADRDRYWTSYFQAPGVQSSSTSTLNKLFDEYRDQPNEDPDTIGVSGIMKYFENINVDPEEAVVLAIFEALKQTSMGELSREGFVSGWRQLNADTLQKQRSCVETWRSTLPEDAALFKRVYKNTFHVARSIVPGQKALPLENAVAYWHLIFTSPSWSWTTSTTPWLDYWIEYLQDKWKKSVNKDMWEQTLEFARKSVEDESMSWWSEDGAWPSCLDDFVAFVQEKRGPQSTTESMDTS